MPDLPNPASVVWRDNDGQTVHQPNKSDIRAWAGTVERHLSERYADRADAAASTIAVHVRRLWVHSYDAAVGKGGAWYRRSDAVEVANFPARASFMSNGDTVHWLIDEPVRSFEMFGATGDGATDDLPAVQAALDMGGQIMLGVGWNDPDIRPEYVCSTTPVITKPVTLMGALSNDDVRIDNSNTEEGFLVRSPYVTFENFTITANASSGVGNGTGHKGTCITVNDWFVPPNGPEPVKVEFVTIKRMRFIRPNGAFGGHAVAIMNRSRFITIDDCEFIGAGVTGDDGKHSNAILTHWGGHQHGVANTGLDYDAESVVFSAGATVTGGTSGATGYIVKVNSTGSTGTLFIKRVTGTFVDNEALTDDAGGAATMNGAPYSAQVQARFEPGRYSYHPNNIIVRNIKCRNVGRVIACSASYNVMVDGVDYEGPATGGQLVDLPIGDEGATFAAPEDRGKVYSNFLFRNFHAKTMTGAGANGVTAIDISGFGTSKQTAGNLSAYATAAYDAYPYGGRVQPVRRQFKWVNVVFENFTFDYGVSDPVSSTPILRTIYIRNTIGNITFRNITSVPNTSDILAFEVANVRGNISLENCEFLGGVKNDGAEGLHFTNTKIALPTTASGTQAFASDGSKGSVAITAAPLAAGATTLPLGSPCPRRVIVGQRITYAGGMVYCTEYAETGDTVIQVSPLPAPAVASATFVIDQISRDISVTDCDISGGDEAVKINRTLAIVFRGGVIRDAGQYGLLGDVDSEIGMNGTLFSNNGQRRLVDGALTTRDIQVNTSCTFQGENIRFDESALVVENFGVNANAEKASLTNSVFAGTPITGRVNVAMLTNGEPVRFWGNTTGTGAAVFMGGSWTPVVRINDDATGITMSLTDATYTVFDDRVFVDFDLTLTSKGAGAGSVSIDGLPHASTNTSVGQIMLDSVVGLTDPPVMRTTGGVVRFYKQGATGLSSLSAPDITDTTRFIGSITYQRAA